MREHLKQKPASESQRAFCLERVMGIEPTLFAWEARVLPLNDTRNVGHCKQGLQMQTASARDAVLGLALRSFRLEPTPAASLDQLG